jgi:hypothetical protein
MTGEFARVTTYGQPVFTGPGPGPLWRHQCGQLTAVDLMGEGSEQLQPWQYPCGGCGVKDPWKPPGNVEGWLPLLAFTGPLCDQCQGNGWVPISGKVQGAVCGFDTVTECTACESTGMVVTR